MQRLPAATNATGPPPRPVTTTTAMLSWACTSLLLASAPAAEAYTHSMATNSGGQRHPSLGSASRNRRGVAASPSSPAFKLARRGGGVAPLRYDKDDSSSEEEAERLANLDAQHNAFLGAGMGPSGAAMEGGGEGGAEASFVAPSPKKRESKSKLALQVHGYAGGGSGGVGWEQIGMGATTGS